MVRKLRPEPHIAEELLLKMAGAMKEAALFDDLLCTVGGDRSVVERLVEYEHQQKPNPTRLTCLQNAIRRWEQENRWRRPSWSPLLTLYYNLSQECHPERRISETEVRVSSVVARGATLSK